jgi:hypothetical protein
MRIREIVLKLLFLLFLLLGHAVVAAGQAASLSPSSLAFGNQYAGVASPPLNITLSNTSGTVLSISSIQVSGIYPNDFTQTNNCGSSLGAESSCTIAVEMAPQAAGVRTANVIVSDNAPGSPQSVPLSGTGLHDVVLTWTASITPGVTGYYIYRGTVPGGESGTALNPSIVPGTAYVDAAVVPGVLYYYTVKASNGSTLSNASDEASGRVPLSPSPVITL